MRTAMRSVATHDATTDQDQVTASIPAVIARRDPLSWTCSCGGSLLKSHFAAPKAEGFTAHARQCVRCLKPHVVYVPDDADDRRVIVTVAAQALLHSPNRRTRRVHAKSKG